MPADAVPTVELRPIRADDAVAVGAFLHRELNPRVSAEAWAAAVVPPWRVDAPNHGFLLRTDDTIVGVLLAFYSERVVAGVPRRICNIAAWCVTEEHRSHGLRLLRAVLGQRGWEFTDLSPSGNVVALNERLRFRRLDTRTALVLPVPLPSRTRVVTGEARMEALLDDEQRTIHRDHRDAAAARHVVLRRGRRWCYVIFRADRRKGRRLFASVLHASDPVLLRRSAGVLARHVLLRHRLPVTLVELRIADGRPRATIALSAGRPKMYRSSELGPEQVDYLYSELACVAW